MYNSMSDDIPQMLERLASLKNRKGPSASHQHSLLLEESLQRAFGDLLRDLSIDIDDLPQSYVDHPLFQKTRDQVIEALQQEGVLIEELPASMVTPTLQRRLKNVEERLRTLMKKPPHTDSPKKKTHSLTGISRTHTLGLPDCHSMSVLIRENPSLKEKLQQATEGRNLETVAKNGDGLCLEHLIQKKSMVYRECHLFDRWGDKPIALSIAIRKAGMVPKWLYAQSKADPTTTDLDRWFDLHLRATALENVNETLFEYSMDPLDSSACDNAEELPGNVQRTPYTFMPSHIGQSILRRDPSFPDPTEFGKTWSQAWLARMYLCDAFRQALCDIDFKKDLQRLISTNGIGWLIKQYEEGDSVGPFSPESTSVPSIAAGFRGKSRRK